MKLFKAVVAAAFLVPTLVNASSSATVDLQISDFLINFGGPVQIFPQGGTPTPPIPGATRIDVSSIVYAGTGATAELNGTLDGESAAGSPPFSLQGLVGTPATNGAQADVALNGQLFTLGSVSGTTKALASVQGNGSASADAQIINSFDAGIKFDLLTFGDLRGNTVSFNWLLDIILSVFDQGGSANTTYEFDFSVARQGSLAAPFEFALSSADTGVATAASLNTNGFASTGGPLTGGLTTGPFDLLAGQVYTVTINQTASAAVTSVPAPGIIALFGGSLLTIALIRRRKLSK